VLVNIITRKRAIAKALQPKGRPASRQSFWRILYYRLIMCYNVRCVVVYQAAVEHARV